MPDLSVLNTIFQLYRRAKWALEMCFVTGWTTGNYGFDSRQEQAFFSLLQNAHTGCETHKSYLMRTEGCLVGCKTARE